MHEYDQLHYPNNEVETALARLAAAAYRDTRISAVDRLNVELY